MAIKALIIGVAAAALATTAAVGETPSKAEFVGKAGASDTFEIDSARLMVTSQNPSIKAFATQMITDHSKSTKMVQSAARLDHVALKKPSMSVGQRTDLTALKTCPRAKPRTIST